MTEQPPTGVTELAAVRIRKAAAPTIHEDLRAWAKGIDSSAAAVELLIRGFDGRYAAADNPWIQSREHVGHWVDVDAIPGNIGALSSCERAYLLITASIGSGRSGGSAINLGETIPALGPTVDPGLSRHRPRQRQPPIQRHRNRPAHRNTQHHPAGQPVPMARLTRPATSPGGSSELKLGGTEVER